LGYKLLTIIPVLTEEVAQTMPPYSEGLPNHWSRQTPIKYQRETYTYLLLCYEDVGPRSGHLIAGGRPASPDQQTERKSTGVYFPAFYIQL